eukprot:g11756.t1
MLISVIYIRKFAYSSRDIPKFQNTLSSIRYGGAQASQSESNVSTDSLTIEVAPLKASAAEVITDTVEKTFPKVIFVRHQPQPLQDSTIQNFGVPRTRT